MRIRYGYQVVIDGERRYILTEDIRRHWDRYSRHNPWSLISQVTAVAREAAELNGPRVTERRLSRLGLRGLGLGG